MRLAFLLLPLLAGCDIFDQGDCTDEFRIYDVAVLLPDGSPASEAEVTATNRRTGTTYGPCTDPQAPYVGCFGRGGSDSTRYVVYSDVYSDETSRRGDDVTVTAEQGGLASEAAFRFRSGSCNSVQKRSGPDTLTLQ